MTAITFDTHAFVKELKAVGFTEEQAETQVKVMSVALESSLATKADISLVRQEIKEMELRLTLRFGAMLAVSVGVIVGAFFAIIRLIIT